MRLRSRPDHSLHHNTMTKRIRYIIVGLRLGAAMAVTIGVWCLWRLMLWLPWQADCVMAAVAVLTFAYKFEREAVG